MTHRQSGTPSASYVIADYDRLVSGGSCDVVGRRSFTPAFVIDGYAIGRLWVHQPATSPYVL